jgi:hypothetical protein
VNCDTSESWFLTPGRLDHFSAEAIEARVTSYLSKNAVPPDEKQHDVKTITDENTTTISSTKASP